jgi:tetratricopeptide (TPR) repeat protein
MLNFRVDQMTFQETPNNLDLKFRKIMGRTYLNESRLEEAVEIYTSLLRDYPDDVDSLLVLGNLYLASGDGKTARKIYEQAQELAPNNRAIELQIELAKEEESFSEAEPMPTDTKAIAKLLQRLIGKKRIIYEEDIYRVANLLQEIIQSDRPADLVAKRLDEIDELLPALVEINVRQAIADGKPELAQALRNLQENIFLQKDEIKAREEEAGPDARQDSTPSLAKQFSGHVQFLVPAGKEKSERMGLLQTALRSKNCQVTVTSEFQSGVDVVPDVAIVSNPHTNPKLLEGMAALAAASVPIILDLDEDFENLPVSHPDYGMMGLNTPSRARAHTTALLLANLITVNSSSLANTFQEIGYHTRVIPEGWSSENALWGKQVGQRKQINIGWVNSSGQLEDLAMIRRVAIRILREFADTQIVVIGDSNAYRLFESIPENRRIFLPTVDPSEYPYLLSQVDILLVPVRDDPFHMCASDRILMEAGVKNIPWVASPVPAFKEWHVGGLVANNLDEWYIYIRQLVMDAELRKNFGQAGSQTARSREMSQLTNMWLQAITDVIRSADAGTHPSV